MGQLYLEETEMEVEAEMEVEMEVEAEMEVEMEVEGVSGGRGRGSIHACQSYRSARLSKEVEG